MPVPKASYAREATEDPKLDRMQQELGYSYAQIAERLGKSKGYVQNRMRLLQLG